MYWYVLVCTGMYCYVLVYFTHIYNVILVLTVVVCAGYHHRDPTISVQHCRRSWQRNPYNPTQVQQEQGFRISLAVGCAESADPAASDGRRGCDLYEVNTWLWNFGRGKPRLGGLTV